MKHKHNEAMKQHFELRIRAEIYACMCEIMLSVSLSLSLLQQQEKERKRDSAGVAEFGARIEMNKTKARA